ncbi:MAG: radical SAM/SPASM domain-containing protein [Candidatus Scalinduaceae bacterium]
MPSDWTFVSVDMELTNRCSSDCLMCPRYAINRQKGIMSEDVFKVIMEKLVDEGSLVTFSGMGDPLSHPKVFEWIYDIRHKGGDAGIVVNPASLNDNISRKLVEAKPNSITLSFPSVRKEVFERLCPKTSFDDALERAQKLNSLTIGNVGLRVVGLITEINEDEPGEYLNFWKNLGVPSSMIMCHGRGGNLKIPGIYDRKSVGLKSGRCGLFQFHTFITWEGEVLACCHDLTGDTLIGSLADDDISVVAERKQEIAEGFMPFTVCQQCDEPLRQYSLTQGLPPEGRKERNRFFRSISLKKSSLSDAHETTQPRVV